MSQEKYPEYAPWEDHVYAALRWLDGAAKKLHDLAESETLTEDVRHRAANTVSWLESARREAFFAFEKMGGSGTLDAKLDVSSIGNETKVKVLRLNASFIEAALATAGPGATAEMVRDAMASVIQTLREEAAALDEDLKRGLDGPIKGDL